MKAFKLIGNYLYMFLCANTLGTKNIAISANGVSHNECHLNVCIFIINIQTPELRN